MEQAQLLLRAPFWPLIQTSHSFHCVFICAPCTAGSLQSAGSGMHMQRWWLLWLSMCSMLG